MLLGISWIGPQYVVRRRRVLAPAAKNIDVEVGTHCQQRGGCGRAIYFGRARLGGRGPGDTQGTNWFKVATRFFGRREPRDWRRRLQFGLHRGLRNRDVPDVADLAMLFVERIVMPVADRLGAQYADR